jgi:predicted DNA-binding transcriptional regulator YafY
VRTATRGPLERIAALDRQIRAGTYPNARTIAQDLEVSPRTIHRDIEFLRERLGAPLAYDQIRHGFRYTNPTYRLPAWMLTEGEVLTLILAQRVLRQYRGTPYAAQLECALRKLAGALDDEVSIDLADLDGALSLHTAAPPDIDPGRFSDLLSAVRGRRRLLIHYRDHLGCATRREVDPYHLAAIDETWYLVAYCHLRRSLRTFVPDRISALEPTGETFDRDPDFSIDAYLASSLVVFHGAPGESHRVVLRFLGVAAATARVRPLHVGQRLADEHDGAVTVTMDLSHLREAERLALSWGDDCEVLAPPELRDRVAAAHRRAAAAYDAPGPTDPSPTAPRKRPSRPSRSGTPCR